jgi:hypothetical protein
MVALIEMVWSASWISTILSLRGKWVDIIIHAIHKGINGNEYALAAVSEPGDGVSQVSGNG